MSDSGNEAIVFNDVFLAEQVEQELHSIISVGKLARTLQIGDDDYIAGNLARVLQSNIDASFRLSL